MIWAVLDDGARAQQCERHEHPLRHFAEGIVAIMAVRLLAGGLGASMRHAAYLEVHT